MPKPACNTCLHEYTVQLILSTIVKTCLLSAFTCMSIVSIAQKEGNNWFFGYRSGLNFDNGQPVFQKGSINQWEGSASISDSKGRLLFYTNGGFVWDKNHKLMPNGKGLKGHNSSTQSSIIVPKPGNSNLYYLFTVTATGGKDGLQYSVLDMHANGGLGDIIEKNIQLLTPVCEKITAVRHGNNRDIWVITHKYNSDEYCAYLVTGDGISMQPVISKTGNVISGGLNAIGYLKACANGTKLAAAHMTSFTEVLDFDHANGRITNPIKLLHNQRSYAYGVEFSRKAEFLYVSEMNHTNGTGNYTILQYQVSANPDSMTASRQIAASGNVGGAAGALQLGPDNRMYIAFNQKNYLGCLMYPERAGKESGFVLEHISLPGGKSGLGLPTFIQSYFLESPASSGYLNYAIGFVLLLILILIFFWRRKNKKSEVTHSAKLK